jgi:hypothetical protein
MDSAKQQLTDKLKTANNVLVTVSRNPSVDQLSSCIGLTLLLNKQGKHAAAVFSGNVPSTLEFLEPENTLEKNTDSLRDFIIALDKSKADKLRYKVEDNVVRIFITPYKTSISQADLDFSEGDFNVDVVVALGVLQQEDLDEAITAHGRILHDATVTSINTGPDGGLGTINWYDPQASSLSELVTELAQTVGENLLDQQIATALLTGIVSETNRFSNDKTSSQTMSASAVLMAAGANQQLVASKLEEPASQVSNKSDTSNNGSDEGSSDDQAAQNNGVLEINHYDKTADQNSPTDDAGKEPVSEPPSGPETVDLPSELQALPESTRLAEPASSSSMSPGPKMITEPPTMGGTLTANSQQEGLDPATDPFGLPTEEPPQLLDRKENKLPESTPLATTETSITEPAQSTSATVTPGFTPPPPSWVPPSTDQANPAASQSSTSQPSDADDRTIIALESSVASPHVVNSPLTELEKSVGSSHVTEAENLGVARDEVSRALADPTSTASSPPEPIQALNAQSLGDDLHPDNTDSQVTDLKAPPPVPPPIPFQFGNSSQPQ